MSTQYEIKSANQTAENSSASIAATSNDAADNKVAKKKSGRSIYQEVTRLKRRVASLELLLSQIYSATCRDKFSGYTEKQVKALLERVSAAEMIRKSSQPSTEELSNDSSPNSAAPQVSEDPEP